MKKIMEKSSWISTLAVGLVLTATQSAAAVTPAKDTAQNERKVVVFAYNYAKVPDGELREATKVAAKIFKRIGVELDWRNCPVEATEAAHECLGSLPMKPIYLRILRRTKAQRQMSNSIALGHALHPGNAVAGTNASVFLDRVEEIASLARFADSLVLGMSAAHEIGHLLLPVAKHERKGLMRVAFRRTEIQNASHGRLGFTNKQAKLIREAVGLRMS